MKDMLLNNRYRLIQLIGKGGMADVYLAYDTTLEREVAVKILHDHLADDSTFIDNFRKEAQAAGKLVDSNIVGIYDVGTDKGKYYIVMEYVKGGRTLKDELEEHTFSLEESLSYALDIAEGLKAAHDMGFVHCDIKPQNILITENKKAKITDFGIARINTSSSTLVFGKQEIMGTAHYISPEQIQGGVVDSRSDLYSLGVVIYEMIVGEKAFNGENPVSIALKHLNETPLPVSLCCQNIPEKLCQTVQKLMSKNVQARYSSVDDVIHDLLEISDSFNYSRNTTPIKKNNSTSRNFLEKKARKGLPKKTWVMLLILLFVVSFGGVFALISDFGSTEITVPNVEGLKRAEAIKEIESLGLKVEVSETMDGKNEEDKVLKQTPIGGAKVKKGRIIALLVSGKSGETIAVPSLVGLTQTEAGSVLEKSKLVLGRVSVGWDATKPAGVILKQDILPGDLVSQKTEIHITVNPEGVVTLPDLQGKQIKEAEQIIQKLGLQVVIQEKESSSEKGVVLDQNPAAGSSMLNEGQVTLTIAKSENKANQISVSYKVPTNIEKAKIQIIKVSSDKTEKTLYSKTLSKGEVVHESVDVQKGDRILVFSNGNLVLEK